MTELHDYELQRTPGDPGRPSAWRPVVMWIAGGVLLVAVAIAVYIVFNGRGAKRPPPPAASLRDEAPAAQPLGGPPSNIVVPALDMSDPTVRDLVSKLSSHPQIAAWLTTNGLIRNFAVVVSNVSEGSTPSGQLTPLKPGVTFTVETRRVESYIDPRSYARYDGIAAAAQSVNPQGAAQVYSTLKPRIEEAYRDLGFPDTPFDRTLERAIIMLLRTPLVQGPIRLVPKGGGYAFADPALEALPGAQKQLIRTGPENTRRIQASLRSLAQALGIPPQRLPPAR